jgi:hypothetical protein
VAEAGESRISVVAECVVLGVEKALLAGQETSGRKEDRAHIVLDMGHGCNNAYPAQESALLGAPGGGLNTKGTNEQAD